MKKTSKNFADLPPIRVRKEPPTLVEAVAAAQDLADDVEQQVEIAAGLIGLALDEVRPHVVAAAKARQERPKERFSERMLDRAFERMPDRVMSPGSPSRAPRTVVVERRTRPTVVIERRSGRPLEPRR
ncbi:hypothetical protein GCM10007887_27330 [Methylobacterium haplocladii]|uniref:Uncharacterized protein n=1 Tax=Methylobacterium haplocladii TaxID=1176176 RepID=A0A512INQ1_9HYPH|nr:hypothetical protein [Methylobacterium haplocladii]GEO99339.1 hypothetical protein MHA02_17270 [Methylobacterium haplocladii]GLS60057.1 hypothetical protein GCM10007887_27330 [Methylobacterium haplocladii]